MKLDSRKYFSHSCCAKQFGEVNGIGGTGGRFLAGECVTLSVGVMSWQAIGNSLCILTSPEPEKRVCIPGKREKEISRNFVETLLVLSAESRIYFTVKVNHSERLRLR